jgi:hypothetical protein
MKDQPKKYRDANGAEVIGSCETCGNIPQHTGVPCPPEKVNLCQPSGKPWNYIFWYAGPYVAGPVTEIVSEEQTPQDEGAAQTVGRERTKERLARYRCVKVQLDKAVQRFENIDAVEADFWRLEAKGILTLSYAGKGGAVSMCAAALAADYHGTCKGITGSEFIKDALTVIKN